MHPEIKEVKCVCGNLHTFDSGTEVIHQSACVCGKLVPNPFWDGATGGKLPVTESILSMAEKIIYADKPSQYGDVKESYNKIASIATKMINKDLHLTAKDCLKVMIAVKLVRESYKHKRDNLIDAAGYLGLLDEVLDNV